MSAVAGFLALIFLVGMLLAGAVLRRAESPPVAYAAGMVGTGCFIGLCLSLVVLAFSLF